MSRSVSYNERNSEMQTQTKVVFSYRGSVPFRSHARPSDGEDKLQRRGGEGVGDYRQ